MRNGLYVLVTLFLVGCSGVKRSEKNLMKGDYYEAIFISVDKLKKGKNNKSRKQHIAILEEAFKLATKRDLARIRVLEKEQRPKNTGEIHGLYSNLDKTQKTIQSLFPLEGAKFKFDDYTSRIEEWKSEWLAYEFQQGDSLLRTGKIFDARRAHVHFTQVQFYQPNKPNIDSLINAARIQGTDFVHVVIENRTEQVIPKRLEQAILDFDTYKLDNYWTEYHGVRQQGYEYSFGIILEIRQILISPDRLYEKEFTREKRIADGWQYVLDDNGNVLKDSLGNDVKEDKFKDLLATVIVSTQDKSVALTGNILYRNLQQGRNFQTHPIASEFVFKHVFASFDGDEEALTREDKRLIRRAYVDFPSNEQMIFDTSTDLKNKFAAILRRKKLR